MATNGFLLFNGRTMRIDLLDQHLHGIGRSVIDLVWVNISGLRWIKDLRVLEPTFPDHFPVELHLRCADVTETHVADDSVH